VVSVAARASPSQKLAQLANSAGSAGLPPVQIAPVPSEPIPVLIGGGGEKKTLRLVARHADIWHSFGDPETVERKVAILGQHCADVGRDPADIEVSVGVSGSPDELGPKLRSVGASLFTVGVGGPDYDLSDLRKWIAWRDSQHA